jgi:CHAT domain-containing protein
MRKIASIILLFIGLKAGAQPIEDILINRSVNPYNRYSLDSAIIKAEKEIAATKNPPGAEAQYAEALIVLGAAHYSYYHYEKALDYFTQASEVRKRLYGTQHSAYASCLTYLSIVYEKTGKPETSIATEWQALELLKKESGSNTLEHARSLNHLGNLYVTLGKYDSAASFLQQAVEIKKKVLPEENFEYAMALNDLAFVHDLLDDYQAAEKLYRKSAEIQKQHRPIFDNPSAGVPYIETIARLGMLYYKMGNWDIAEKLLKEASDEAVGLAFYQYNTTLMVKLAMIYTAKGKYADAERLYRWSLNYLYLGPGTESQEAALIRYHLGQLYEKMGARGGLEQYVKAFEILEKLKGPENLLYYASVSNSIASVFNKDNTSAKDYEVVASLLERSLDIRRELLGSLHPDYILTVHLFALHFRNIGENQKAEELESISQQLMRDFLLSGLDFLSESELIRFINNYNKTDETISLIEDFKEKHKSLNLNAEAYNNLLFYKGIGLYNSLAVLQSIQHSKNTALAKLWKDAATVKNLLHAQELLPYEKRVFKIDSLQELVNEYDKKLVEASSTVRDGRELLSSSWQTVQLQLEPGEASIEFIRFQYSNKDWSSNYLYAAFLIRASDTIPQYIFLCREEDIEKVFGNNKDNTGALYITRSSIKKSTGETAPDKRLYDLVWHPLIPYLKDVKKIYYSPSGLLHRIAFSALPASDSNLLMEQYELVQLFSTRNAGDIITQGDKAINNISLFGGIDYDRSEESVADTNNRYSLVYSKRGSGMGSFNYLPGTLEEVKKIASLYQSRKLNYSLVSGKEATETAFRKLDGHAPEVLHISTHGFSLPDPPANYETDIARNTYSMAMDPLARCGLVFAGGNKAWIGETIKGDDEILTGREIATMNFSGCKLVVLSACETGLGNLQGTEGIFGLQRAFKAAGVEAVMVSLWPVPDKETVEFMEQFYSNWHKTNNIENAFRETQLYMKKKYPPQLWAAFILLQ